MIDEKFKIKKIGWDKQNDVVSVVLVDKKTRDKLGVNVGDLVKVLLKGQGIEAGVIASVGMQFKEFVDKPKTCSVNTQLAEKLEVKLNSEVIISKEVTESEYKQFIKDLKQTVFFGF